MIKLGKLEKNPPFLPWTCIMLVLMLKEETLKLHSSFIALIKNLCQLKILKWHLHQFSLFSIKNIGINLLH